MPSVLVVGDVMADVVVRPEGPLAIGADRRATIRVLPGGSGANQATWLAVQGVDVTFAGRVGRADHAYQSALLEQAGVRPALAADSDLPTGALVTLLSPDGERSFLTDRAANLNLRREDLPDKLLTDIDFLHVSGYSFFAEGPRAAVLDLLGAAQQRGIPFSVDPASWSFLREVGPENFLRWTEAASVAFPNEDEAAELTGTRDLEAQLQSLSRTYPLVVLKRGAAGAAAADAAGGRWATPAPAAEIVDPSGAGDAFLGGFLGAWLAGAGVEAALRSGVELATRAVTTLGARPPARLRL